MKRGSNDEIVSFTNRLLVKNHFQFERIHYNKTFGLVIESMNYEAIVSFYTI